MLYDYLSMGGQEIVNSARAFGYASTASCPFTGLLSDGCETLEGALEAIGAPGGTYTYSQITSAPWYDVALDDLSRRFMGVYGMTFENFKNSTRRAEIVDRFSEGGVIGRQTHSAREVVVRALVVAQGRDALDFGIEWLSKSLDAGSCGQHSTRCGLTDLEFFDDCPPEQGSFSSEEYSERVQDHLRFLHDVRVTSGPLVVEEKGSGDGWWLYEVEFTVGSEQAYVYSRTTPTPISISDSFVISDAPKKNLFAYPSAELWGAFRAVEKNIIPNPSFEKPLFADFWTVGENPDGAETPIFVVGTYLDVIPAHGNSMLVAISVPANPSPAGEVTVEFVSPTYPAGTTYSFPTAVHAGLAIAYQPYVVPPEFETTPELLEVSVGIELINALGVSTIQWFEIDVDNWDPSVWEFWNATFTSSGFNQVRLRIRVRYVGVRPDASTSAGFAFFVDATKILLPGGA